MFVLTVAAAEAAIGLAILVIFFRRRGIDRGRRRQPDARLMHASPSSSSSCRCSPRSSRAWSAAWIGKTAAKVVTTGALFIGAFLSWPIFFQYIDGNAEPVVVPVHDMDPVGHADGRLGAARRRADRGHAGRRHDRLQPRPPLQLGLYGGGSEPAALLRLSVAVHLRDADAGDGRQPRPDVLRLGRRRPRFLPADRLLVSQAVGQCGGAQGLRRQPRRRLRLLARHLRHVPGVRHRLDPGDPCGGARHGRLDDRLCSACASTR